jgi:hypothetical protein
MSQRDELQKIVDEEFATYPKRKTSFVDLLSMPKNKAIDMERAMLCGDTIDNVIAKAKARLSDDTIILDEVESTTNNGKFFIYVGFIKKKDFCHYGGENGRNVYVKMGALPPLW